MAESSLPDVNASLAREIEIDSDETAREGVVGTSTSAWTTFTASGCEGVLVDRAEWVSPSCSTPNSVAATVGGDTDDEDDDDKDDEDRDKDTSGGGGVNEIFGGVATDNPGEIEDEVDGAL